MKSNTLRCFTLTLLAALFLTFSACNNQSPNSPNASVLNATNLDEPENVANAGSNAQALLKTGPISNERAAAVELPAKKITRKEGELNIIKVETKESLQKKFISTWIVTPTSQGWIYTGDAVHGRTWLYFPYNAVNWTTYITVDWESTGLLTGGVNFSPHGTQFNHPVTVWISYKDVDLGGINPADLKIWYWNETTQLWELIGDTIDLGAQEVGGLLHHFSRYALGTE